MNHLGWSHWKKKIYTPYIQYKYTYRYTVISRHMYRLPYKTWTSIWNCGAWVWNVLPIKAYALPDLLADWRCKGNQKAWSLRSKFTITKKQVEQSWIIMNVKTLQVGFFPCFFFVIFLSIICNTWGRFDPFEILEVSPGASAAEVKKANLPVFLETPLDFWDEACWNSEI